MTTLTFCVAILADVPKMFPLSKQRSRRQLKPPTPTLREPNEKRRNERTARLDSVTDAIRDVWAAQEFDEPKALVERFVKA